MTRRALRTAALFAIGAAIVLAMASQAKAYTIGPTGPATAHGALLAVTPGQPSAQSCPATWTITITKAGAGKVMGLSIAGGPNVFSGFPWAVKATGLNGLTIKGATWLSPTGACGPVNLSATLAHGTIGVNYAAGGCEFITGATTNPTLSVAP